MNVGIGTEAAQFLFQEYINLILVLWGLQHRGILDYRKSKLMKNLSYSINMTRLLNKKYHNNFMTLLI
jgi:hypothetical protein